MQNESNLKVRELFSIPLLKMKVWEDTEELNDCEDYILSKLQITSPEPVSYTHLTLPTSVPV